MRLESVVVSGFRMQAWVEQTDTGGNLIPLSGRNNNYKALIAGKWYACQMGRNGYVIKGDKIEKADKAVIGDKPLFPKYEDRERNKIISNDIVPGLDSI